MLLLILRFECERVKHAPYKLSAPIALTHPGPMINGQVVGQNPVSDFVILRHKRLVTRAFYNLIQRFVFSLDYALLSKGMLYRIRS